jgi:hypothetical protein
LIRNKDKEGGLGPARKPSPGMFRDNKPLDKRPLSTYSNAPVSNNICHVCGGDHNVLIISLENGGHIITHPFSKEKATRVKVDSGIKGKAIGLDLIDIFWPKDGDI